MVEPTRLHALDCEAEILHSRRSLPHWFQPHAATFVTFRTADSMPQSAVQRWLEQQRLFLKTHKINVELTDAGIAKLPPHLAKQFKRFRTSSFNKLLDKSFGACELRSAEIASVVAEKLWFFNGVRYDLDCFVVMPNHVHVIVGIRRGGIYGKNVITGCIIRRSVSISFWGGADPSGNASRSIIACVPPNNWNGLGVRSGATPTSLASGETNTFTGSIPIHRPTTETCGGAFAVR